MQSMHIGKANPGFSYVLGGTTLQETKKERALGASITDDLKYADQVASNGSKLHAVEDQQDIHLT